MIRTVFSSLFAVALFAMGAVGAWYFVQFQEQQEEAATEQVNADEMITMSASATASDPIDAGTRASSDPDTATPLRLPAPVRGRTMTPEEQFRVGVLYAEQIDEIKAREQQLQEQENRLQLARKDIDQRKLEVEGMLEQVKTHVDRGEQLVSHVQEERRLLEEERQLNEQQLEEIKNASRLPPDVEKTNVTRISKVLGGMSETVGADVIRELANKGNMDYALMLLDSIEERDASKILDALGDPSLVAEITEAYKGIRRAQTKKRR